jgi:hypothetical protein
MLVLLFDEGRPSLAWPREASEVAVTVAGRSLEAAGAPSTFMPRSAATGSRRTQNEPNAEPSAITTISATIDPTIPTITMSK